MPIKIQKWVGPRGGAIYDDSPRSYSWPTEKLTAYTEAEEAAHIRQIVSLALAHVDPADFDRCGPEELVERPIRAMSSAIITSVDAAKVSAQADYEQRIRSALVDVQVEPVAFVSPETIASLQADFGGLYQMKPAKWKTDETTVPLYTKPPHREGEDSAEVIEALEAAQEWVAILQGSTGNVVTPDGDERNPREIGDRANRLIRAALAATRSGSAATAKGCAE